MKTQYISRWLIIQRLLCFTGFALIAFTYVKNALASLRERAYRPKPPALRRVAVASAMMLLVVVAGLGTPAREARAGLLGDILGLLTGVLKGIDPYNPGGLLKGLLDLPKDLLGGVVLGDWDMYATDQPGSWWDTKADSLYPILHTNSLGVTVLGSTTVSGIVEAPDTHSKHTFTSLFWPTGATGMPFEQPQSFTGIQSLQLTKPGLYAFVCKMHPFMLAAVLVDNPLTVGFDLGKSTTTYTGLTIPTASDMMYRLLRAFFVITNPKENWQYFKANVSAKWDPKYPAVPLLAYDQNQQSVLILNFDSFMQDYFHEPVTLPALFKPTTPGVGEVWIDTQYEKTANKTKPGTATAVNTNTWSVTKKIALPSVNMNNPHNMWTNANQTIIYQTNWFDRYLDVFNRTTGAFLWRTEVGDAPSHVMTRSDTDQVHVAINGEGHIVELSPGGATIDRVIPVQHAGENAGHPHAHWMSASGDMMVTPNSNTNDSSLIDVPTGDIISKPGTGFLPIASSMSGDSTKYYVANFLEHSISCVSVGAPACNDGATKVPQKKISLNSNYDPVSGAVTGPMGMLPIQTPVGPTGKYVLTANTLSNTITVIDTDTDTLVKSLPCDAGCHGINFGAKKGGGYYAYVSSKFANTLIIVDPDPNNDGEPGDAKIVGRMLLDATTTTTVIDDTPTLYIGQGGQGVLPIPLVYNGWVQKLPAYWKAQLTPEQLNPIP